jgi:hypothetical protein
MSTAKTDHFTSQRHKGPNLNGSPDIQALIRSLEIANQRGALFFLAAQLAPLLVEYCEKNGEITSVELEVLITQAIREMGSQGIPKTGQQQLISD